MIRSNLTSTQSYAANFALLSQQVGGNAKKKGFNQLKHIEFQKALKAQADKNAAEKRKASLTASQFRDFTDR